MSIRPINFNADGSIDVVYDEMGHSGTIPAAEIRWTTGIDGTTSHNYIVLQCPDGCGASSTHPVGGGAAPPDVQQMFVNKVQAEGCACGNVAGTDANSVGEGHMQLLCNRMDGPGRWQIASPARAATALLAATGLEAAPTTFEVIYRPSDRLIVGVDPDGSVGANYAVQAVALDQYEVLMRTDPAYLSADNQRIVATPELAQAA